MSQKAAERIRRLFSLHKQVSGRAGLCRTSFSMVVFSYSGKRSTGRSATAAAACRSASVIACEREGREHDYTAKCGVEACFSLAPDDAPSSAQDRAVLRNAAEA